MPDTSTPPASPTDAPPTEDGWRPDLTVLRARLDELDDKIHDLLMDRARVIESVARSGKAAAFRPGREAAILRRLLARHTGNLPPQTLIRMWRELLAGTTAMQTAVSVAVFDSSRNGAISDIAREHFGFLTPMIELPTAEAALRAVRSGNAVVAVLPFPDGTCTWWPGLTGADPRLHIIARLPFWAHRPGLVPNADALVVGTAAPDASGADRSFIATREGAGPNERDVIRTYGTIAEMDGMVSDNDPRLPTGSIVLGGYAIPVAGEQP